MKGFGWKLAGLLALGLFCYVACQKDEEPDNTASVSARKTMVEADAGSTFVEISVKENTEWTLSLEYPSGTEAWASVEPASGVGPLGNARLRYDENTSEESRSVTLVLAPKKGAVARASVEQIGASGASIARYGYDVAPMDWLELPAMTAGDGRELLVHAMDGGKYVSKTQNGTRNWSCYWDYKEHLSPWVAYPQNASLIKSGSRPDPEPWAYDPLLPASIQPNLTNNSYGGGWTRGHQIASADRYYSIAANASTYVPTNMTPQQWDFNGGIWADLEDKVRSYSRKSDTLYVVTGCCIENSTRTSGTNSGFAVKIPTHYFKALLYKGSASEAKATDGYMAAGYLLPHDKSIAEGDYKDYIMSIDELEKQTGWDFFPNLIKKIGQEKADQIESTLLSWW